MDFAFYSIINIINIIYPYTNEAAVIVLSRVNQKYSLVINYSFLHVFVTLFFGFMYTCFL